MDDARPMESDRVAETDHPKEAALAFRPLVSLLEQILADAAAAGAGRPNLDHRRIAGVLLQAIMFLARPVRPILAASATLLLAVPAKPFCKSTSLLVAWDLESIAWVLMCSAGPPAGTSPIPRRPLRRQRRARFVG